MCRCCTLALAFVFSIMSSLSIYSYLFNASSEGVDIWRFSNILSLGRILKFLVRCLIFEVYFFT